VADRPNLNSSLEINVMRSKCTSDVRRHSNQQTWSRIDNAGIRTQSLVENAVASAKENLRYSTRVAIVKCSVKLLEWVVPVATTKIFNYFKCVSMLLLGCSPSLRETKPRSSLRDDFQSNLAVPVVQQGGSLKRHT
jgi:hypothetical protein